MITLITGAPGSGKSLLLVDEFLSKAKEDGRIIVADGIPDLVVEHEPATTVDGWTKTVPDPSSQDGKKLLFTFTEGALVVVDECQRIFRPRRAGAAVPPEVAAFETHRHQGLDFVLITQHPGLLDQNVRRLVGRHLHIRDVGFLGRWVYEWPEASDPERFKTAPVKRKWSLPKKSFSLYKSSSLHVKPQRGFPTAVKVLAVAAVVMAGGVYYGYESINRKLHPQPVESVKQQDGQSKLAAAPVPEYNPIEQSLPRHPNYPESAPMYDQLRQVKVMPQVVGCIATSKKCECVNQQGTKESVTDDFCHRYIDNPPFNPYAERQEVVKQETPKAEPSKPDTPAVIASSGAPGAAENSTVPPDTAPAGAARPG